MDFGAGRYWGDDGADDELDPWDPWPLEKLWRPQAAQAAQARPQAAGLTMETRRSRGVYMVDYTTWFVGNY